MFTRVTCHPPGARLWWHAGTVQALLRVGTAFKEQKAKWYWNRVRYWKKSWVSVGWPERLGFRQQVENNVGAPSFDRFLEKAAMSSAALLHAFTCAGCTCAGNEQGDERLAIAAAQATCRSRFHSFWEHLVKGDFDVEIVVYKLSRPQTYLAVHPPDPGDSFPILVAVSP